MSYQAVFALFWEQVKESVQEGTFAKITMAKTIGKPNLKNIFVRPINSKDDFKVLVKFSYRSRETEDTETACTLEETFGILESHLKAPFYSVLLFTTAKDLIFKINKKGAGRITETAASFREIKQVEID